MNGLVYCFTLKTPFKDKETKFFQY